MSRGIKKWKEVIFEEEKAPDAATCEITFRTSGQIVFRVPTLEALGYPSHIKFYHSEQNNQIAIGSASKEDAGAIKLSNSELVKEEPCVISSKKLFDWLYGLLNQEVGQVLINLSGARESDGKVVFDLSAAGIKAKQARAKKES